MHAYMYIKHYINKLYYYYYYITYTPYICNSFQDTTAENEDFPTVQLDDNIWLEDPVLDRHLCIHKQSQPYYQCSYPCPYSLDLPHFTPENHQHHTMR